MLAMVAEASERSAVKRSLGPKLALMASIVVGSPPAGYYLVWGDEFNEASLNTNNWDYWVLGKFDSEMPGKRLEPAFGRANQRIGWEDTQGSPGTDGHDA